jgi:hypothetical protein
VSVLPTPFDVGVFDTKNEENHNLDKNYIQLEKGTHSFWLKVTDNQDVEAWYDLGSVNAVNDLTTEPETGGSGSTNKNKMQDAIRDTLISVILTTPVAGVVVYRRRNTRK